MVARSRDAGAARAARRLNEPRPVVVRTTGEEIPEAVNRVPVASVREEWRVAERWWTGHPIRRRYFDVVLETGENTIVFLDETRGCWFTQCA